MADSTLQDLQRHPGGAVYPPSCGHLLSRACRAWEYVNTGLRRRWFTALWVSMDHFRAATRLDVSTVPTMSFQCAAQEGHGIKYTNASR
jgi:hypothetical protein